MFSRGVGFENYYSQISTYEKIHGEQSSQAGSLSSENPMKLHDLATLKILIQRNSDDIITCPKICKLLH